MPLKVTCPSCQSNYQLADNVAGHKVRCKNCQFVFRVGGGAAPGKVETGIRKDRPSSPAIAPVRRPFNDDVEERPRSNRRFRDDDETSKANPMPWIIGAGAGGVLLLVGVVVGIIVLGRSSTPKTPENLPAVSVNTVVPTTTPAATKPLPLPPVTANAGNPIEPGGKDDTIPLQTLQAIKDATVYIKVEAAQGRGSGSGFVMSAQGDTALVVTNQHVANPKFKYEGPSAVRPRFGPPIFGMPRVVNARDVKVSAVFGSGTAQEHAYPAEVLADDEEHDLAILKVAGVRNLPAPIDFSQEVKLVETMPIYSFGFPFGQALAVSKGNPAITVGKGSVSSIRLDDHGELAVVQIDGALNPGNSGGPIVDTHGRLIGVAVAIIKDANNIGLAIPSRQLTHLVRGGVGTVDVKVVRRDQQSLEVEVTAQVIDLWQRIKDATLHYRTGLPLPGQTKDAFAALPDIQKVPLTINQGKATARFSVPLKDRPAIDLVCQVVLGDNEGKTIPTSLTSHTLRNALGSPNAAAPAQIAAADPADQPPPGWKEYSPKDHAYTVWIPDKQGRKHERERTSGARGLQMKLSTLEFEPAGGPAFEAAAVRFSGTSARQVSRSQMMESLRDGVVEASKGKIVDEKPIQQGRLSGKEIVIQTGTGLMRLRLLNSGTRYFLNSVAGSQQQVQGPDALTFLESFRLPAPGTTVQAPPPDQPGAPPRQPRLGKAGGRQDLPTLLAALRGDQFAVGRALDALALAEPVAEEKANVVAALEGVLTTPDQFNRAKAAKALAHWAGLDAVPQLVKLLNDKQFSVRWAVLDLLRDLKASKAAPEVAQALLEQSDRFKAADALKAMGPEAESEVVKLLANPDQFVCVEACKILKDIGTDKSLPELQKTANERKGLPQALARQAVTAIEQRKRAG